MKTIPKRIAKHGAVFCQASSHQIIQPRPVWKAEVKGWWYTLDAGGVHSQFYFFTFIDFKTIFLKQFLLYFFCKTIDYEKFWSLQFVERGMESSLEFMLGQTRWFQTLSMLAENWCRDSLLKSKSSTTILTSWHGAIVWGKGADEKLVGLVVEEDIR